MRILLIEDNPEVCDSLSYQLKKEGFTVDSSYDGEEGYQFIRQEEYDLILLDRMLPTLDGIEILRRTRAGGIETPVILITALGELDDKITGLDTGADDYLVKPFEFRELLARIRSIARRPRTWAQEQLPEYGDLILDDRQKILTCGVSSCLLSVREAQLLKYFLTNPGRNLARSQILSAVWGSSAVEEGNIDNYIFLLRRKLKGVGSRMAITTIHRVGYRLEERDD